MTESGLAESTYKSNRLPPEIVAKHHRKKSAPSRYPQWTAKTGCNTSLAPRKEKNGSAEKIQRRDDRRQSAKAIENGEDALSASR